MTGHRALVCVLQKMVILPWTSGLACVDEATDASAGNETLGFSNTCSMRSTSRNARVSRKFSDLRSSAGNYVFMPFFGGGGPDDRVALTFAVQLCLNANVTATLVKVGRPWIRLTSCRTRCTA